MSQFEEKYIVQDLETHEFLYPDPYGDVGQTPNVKSAGHYDSREDAINAGVEEIGNDFVIFPFFLRAEK